MGTIQKIPPYKPKPIPPVPKPTPQGTPTVPTAGNNHLVTITADVPPPNINEWAEAARRKLLSTAHCLVPVAQTHAIQMSNQATAPIAQPSSPGENEDRMIKALRTLYSHGVITSMLQDTKKAKFSDLLVVRDPQVLRQFLALIGKKKKPNNSDDGDNDNNDVDDDPPSGDC